MKLKFKDYDGGTHKYLTFKRDGYFLEIISKSRELKALSRTGEDYTEYLTDVLWFSELRERGLVNTFYGELWLPGQNASQVVRALKNSPQYLMFDVFGVAEYPVGVDHEVIAKFARDNKLNHVPFEAFHPKTLKEPLPSDTEGYVLTDGHLRNLTKFKPTKTIDLIICKILHGKGKFFGTCGKIMLKTTEGHLVGTASGMTDEQRRVLWENKGLYLGKVVEIEYQFAMNTGLRHPQFVRFREDKTINECSIHQDPDLAKGFGYENGNPA